MSEHEDRPAVVTEVRAWLVVAAAIVMQLIAVTYWAATLSADIKNLQSQVTDFKQSSAENFSASQARAEFAMVSRAQSDHEERIRNLEKSKK